MTIDDRLNEIDAQVHEILATLKRIENRQIRTTEMVEEVKESEAPVIGSFGSSDLGASEKK
jgi:hypothetical protein